ncbi:adult-specific cuticular protein ACP-20-like [Anthonomus grandis grandis]|uniref:adult-specific cuticular protein ACP-20-like n=1 Tax=Anthonomus grandis grandis TaxID=2921223 RepID=UPI0021666D07|nr:adult-specific cuticular protein ACP-20-like [Anthonomus grandis grandis]
MMIRAFTLLFVVAYASAGLSHISLSQGGGGEGGGGHGHHIVELYTIPHYKYKYAVHDSHHHDIHEQHEERYGDKVKGEYSLHEPDGTIRVVKYEADHKNGFNAHVERKGHAEHPHIEHHYHHHD